MPLLPAAAHRSHLMVRQRLLSIRVVRRAHSRNSPAYLSWLTVCPMPSWCWGAAAFFTATRNGRILLARKPDATVCRHCIARAQACPATGRGWPSGVGVAGAMMCKRLKKSWLI